MVELYVLAFLHTQNSVLLLRRHNTSFGQGLYSLVGGKVEHNEPALHAIKREVREEVALNIPENAFNFVHAFHRKGDNNTLVALVFSADISALPPAHNAEPSKHDDMLLFPYTALPTNMLPAHKQAITYILAHRTYSEHGWER